MRMKLKDFCVINPRITLKKGEMAKKIGMTDLPTFGKVITNYTVEEYKGGTKFQNGDTIMARITPCLENGKGGYVNLLDDDEIAFGSTEYIVFREKKGVSDSNFIYYFINTPEFRDIAIKSMTGSSGRQRVQLDVISEMEFEFPELKVQRKIAHILCCLDDKIALNSKLNANLDEVVSLKFKSIYNDSSDSKGTLSEVVRFSNGKKKPDSEGVNPIYGGNGVIGYTDMHNYEEIIVVGRVGAYCGSLYYEPRKCWISDNAIAAKSKTNDNYYVYELLKIQELNSMHIGSSQPLLTQGILNSIEIKLLDKKVVRDFNNWAEYFYVLRDKKNRENCRLRQLRELLLPKLLFGEIDLSNIDIDI